MADSDCIFCRILEGEIPCHKVYEDDSVLAFLDIRPLNPGHVLLIPKKHVQWIDDIEEIGPFFTAARRIAQAQKSKLNAFAVSYLTLGFEVPHAHLHLIPRFKGDGHGNHLDWDSIERLPEEEMKELASDLAEAIGS